MSANSKYAGLLGLALIAGCSPASDLSSAESLSGRAALPGDVRPINLPLRLSDSYVQALDASPEITAQRFLRAYENLAAYGPVTQEKILNHARFHIAMGESQLVSHILAYDLDGNMEISRSEIEAAEAIPIRAPEALDAQPQLRADKNGDDVITLPEAMQFSRALYAQRSKGGLRPIESYLMLFDSNTDGTVTRTEMKVALKPYLGRVDVERGGSGSAFE